MKPNIDHSLRRGFTLIELLVAIGIIAVLIAILLPTIRGARAQAQAAQCASNLRQLFAAQTLHAHDTGERYTTVEFGPIDQKWPVALAKYLSTTGQPADAVAHCPSVSGEQIQPRTEHLPPTMSYGVNPYVMLRKWQGKRTVKMDAANIILMVDKQCDFDDYAFTEDGGYYSNYPAVPNFDGWVIQYSAHRGALARRHSGGRLANALMADGHVQPLDAKQMMRTSGHWYWGSPNLQVQDLGVCPGCN
jgi:prepilin-type N-terminal cleavage/methylation domain-containing protein/prepilin-type processing-associated H-X9-DG protein